MKKLLSLSLLMVASAINFIISASSTKVITLQSLTTRESSSAKSPMRTATIDENGITIHYVFDEAKIVPDKIIPNTYYWNINGFGQSTVISQPSIPVRNDIVEIPTSGDFTITIIDSTYVEYPCVLTPARAAILETEQEPQTAADIPAIKNVNKFYPSNAVNLLSTQYCIDRKLAFITVYPIKYNSATQTVKAFKTLTYRIDFKGNKIFYQEASSHGTTRLNNLISKTAITPTSPGMPIDSIIELPKTVLDPQTYLIISSSRFDSSINKFAIWKKTLGYNVIIKKANWTKDGIRQAIADTYAANPTLKYILIMGKDYDVPTFKIKINNYPNNEDIYSDMPYVCIDGNNDLFPDFYLGRIPAKDDSEANIVIDKIILYEQNPSVDDHFYKNISCCAQFESDASNPSKEGRLFSRTMEEIVQYFSSKKNPIRNYKAANDVSPLLWNDGSEIPLYLRKPTYHWNASKEDILSDINKGCFLVLYRGHGNPQFWAAPYFRFYQNSYSTCLTNRNKLPLIASITCSTGRFASSIGDYGDIKCLAGEFIAHPVGGAIGVFAATATSYSILNDALMCGIIDAIWPGIRLNLHNGNVISPTPLPTYRFGQILYQGLIRMAETCDGASLIEAQMRLYHLFGDPSVLLTTEVPKKCDATIKRMDKAISVNTKSLYSSYTISFFNTNTGDVHRYTGNNVLFKTDTPEAYTVCISGHNLIPNISYASTNKQQIIQQNHIKNLIQSPSSKNLSIEFDLPTLVDDNIKLVNIFTGETMMHELSYESKKADIDISKLSPGQYAVVYMRNNNVLDKKSIIVKH